MSISRISPSTVDNWELISSSTPTSGTTVSFTSISTSWRKLWVTVPENPITTTSSAYLYTQINSISGASDYQIYWATTGNAALSNDEVGIYNHNTTTALSTRVNHFLTNPGNGFPFVTFNGQGGAGSGGSQIWFGHVASATSAITQIDVVASQTIDAANTGTIYLYGTK